MSQPPDTQTSAPSIEASKPDTSGDTSNANGSILAHGRIRRLRWHYLRTAALAAIATTLAGSLIMVTSLVIFFGGDYSFSDFVTLWLIYIVYSGAVVLPLAMFIGFPLMLLLRNQPGWVWTICSLTIGVPLGIIALVAVSHSIRWPVLIIFAVYAGLFGYLATLFRKYQFRQP